MRTDSPFPAGNVSDVRKSKSVLRLSKNVTRCSRQPYLCGCPSMILRSLGLPFPMSQREVVVLREHEQTVAATETVVERRSLKLGSPQ
jgi:hypothetical protein